MLTPFNNFNFFPGLSYYWSAYEENDPRVESVSTVGISLKVEYRFPNGVYFFWDPNFLIPLNGGQTVGDHYFEIGWQINKDWGLFVNYGLLDRNLFNPDTRPGMRDRFHDDVYSIGVRWFY